VAVVVFFIYVRASVTRRNQLTNGEAQKRRLLIGLHLEGEYAEDDDAAVVQYVRDAVQSGGVLVVLTVTLPHRIAASSVIGRCVITAYNRVLLLCTPPAVLRYYRKPNHKPRILPFKITVKGIKLF